MNAQQKGYVAECLKLVGAGQLALLGFSQLASGDVDWIIFAMSVVLGFYLMGLGTMLHGGDGR